MQNIYFIDILPEMTIAIDVVQLHLETCAHACYVVLSARVQSIRNAYNFLSVKFLDVTRRYVIAAKKFCSISRNYCIYFVSFLVLSIFGSAVIFDH